MTNQQRFWWLLLLMAASSLIVFGLAPVVLPGTTQQGFSLLLYGTASHLDTFGQDAVAYLRLVHAVLGAVMFGWGVMFLMLTLGPLRRGSREAWRLCSISLLAWFIPDTTFSLLSGFWQNAVLNTGFALLFAIPLAGLRSFKRDLDTQTPATPPAGPWPLAPHDTE